jgi:peptidoglycan/xylan/chitin deacetylase (PgdA/CDA1 family)
MKRLAGISVDVDSVASHLQGYGFDRPADRGDAYTRAIPRAIELFEQFGIRGTFFLIADEAREHPDIVSMIASENHEIASHSMTHPLHLGTLPAADRQREIMDSRSLLQDLSGQEVTGFRAPGWGLPIDLLPELLAAGYRYDASAFPSAVLMLLRRSVSRRSESGQPSSGRGVGRVGGASAGTRVTPSGPIWEIPIATTPVLRLPYYHTLRYLMPGRLFGVLESAALLRRGPISYVFHAVDFLGSTEDDLDSRIARHPGMMLDLDGKLELCSSALATLASRRTALTLGGIVDRLESIGSV